MASIEEMKTAFGCLIGEFPGEEYCKKCPYQPYRCGACMRDAAKDVNGLIKYMFTWHPISERPEEAGYYNVAYGDGYIECVFYDPYKKEFGYWQPFFDEDNMPDANWTSAEEMGGWRIKYWIPVMVLPKPEPQKEGDAE